MNITPTVLAGGEVLVELDVEDSQFVESVNDNAATETSKKLAKTTTRVSSGRTIVIGGLMLNRHQRANNGLPFLRHVPGLNILFGAQEVSLNNSEVLILVTPYLWEPGLELPQPSPGTLTPLYGVPLPNFMHRPPERRGQRVGNPLQSITGARPATGTSGGAGTDSGQR